VQPVFMQASENAADAEAVKEFVTGAEALEQVADLREPRRRRVVRPATKSPCARTLNAHGAPPNRWAASQQRRGSGEVVVRRSRAVGLRARRGEKAVLQNLPENALARAAQPGSVDEGALG
jgi:hypothetical protein